MDDGFVDYEDPPDAIYDPETKISPKIRFPPEISCESMRILGSCDGLICFCSTGSYGNKLFLFNPSTGKYAARCAGEELSLKIYYRASWFCRHPSTGEYTLFFTGGPKKLHSLNSHRHISIDIEMVIFLYEGIGTMLHGTLHWASLRTFREHDKLAVLGYDMRKNEFRKIGIPKHLQFPHEGVPFTLGVVDECLFLISRNKGYVFELWIMREYWVEESWTKFADIEGCGGFRSLGVASELSRNGDDLILVGNLSYDLPYTILTYSFRDKTSKLVKDLSYKKKAIAYVNSLISPDQILHNWCDID